MGTGVVRSGDLHYNKTMDMCKRTETIHGATVHVQIQGEGYPVLLLHGWGGSTASVKPIADFLRSKYRVISIDFPGHGESSEPPEAWSVTEYGEMVKELLDRLNVEKCHVFGHSFGGRVSIYLSAAYPERVNKLLLCDSAGIMPKRGFKYYFRVYRHKLGKKLAKVGFIDRAFKLSEKAKNAGSADYRALSDNMKKTFIRVVNQDLAPFMPSIRAETLLVWGSEDEATPLWQGRKMESLIKDSALVVFEGAGHFAYLDQYARFCAVYKCFLEGVQ